MLVTLGNNQALGASASQTFPYACKSVQKILVKIDDTTGSTAYLHDIQVQLGSRVIVSSSGYGMFLQNGFWANPASSGTTQCEYQIDLGNHELLHNENLYVRVTAGANAIDAVDISAVVDDPNTMVAKKWTEYTDSVFTASDTLSAICWDASHNTAIDEATGTCEIRDAVNSSAPSFISASNWAQSGYMNSNMREKVGLLKLSSTPLTTSFNYSSDLVDRILVCSQMPVTRQQTNQAKFTSKQRQSAIGR
tara:strand:- start:1326 stop:2075 length:750 start_codon:yes stop_codon:yes gene_type:complete